MSTTIALPQLPELPQAGATPEALAQYNREIERFKAAAFAMQAQAATQAATNTGNIERADLRPTRAQLVWQIVSAQAYQRLSGATTLAEMQQMVSNAESLADAYIDEQPDAVQGG